MGKAVSKHKAELQDKVHALFADIKTVEEQEEQHENSGKDLAELATSSEVSSENLKQAMKLLRYQRQAGEILPSEKGYLLAVR